MVRFPSKVAKVLSRSIKFYTIFHFPRVVTKSYLDEEGRIRWIDDDFECRFVPTAILSQHLLMGVYVIYNPSIILRNGIAAIGRKGITGVGDCKQPIGGSLSTPIHEEKEKKGEEKNRNGSRSHSYGDSVIHASVSLIRELDVEGNWYFHKLPAFPPANSSSFCPGLVRGDNK